MDKTTVLRRRSVPRGFLLSAIPVYDVLCQTLPDKDEWITATVEVDGPYPGGWYVDVPPGWLHTSAEDEHVRQGAMRAVAEVREKEGVYGPQVSWEVP